MFQKKFILSLLFILSIFSVSAISEPISIREGISKIDDAFISPEDLGIIFGDDDSLAYMKIYDAILFDNVHEHSIGPKFIFLSREPDLVETLSDRNIIIAGGPCANSYWTLFSDETCDSWPYKEGEAVAKVAENNDRLILLLAGTSKQDTLHLAQRVSNNINDPIFDQTVAVVKTHNANIDTSTLCEDGVVEANLAEGITYDLTFGDNSINIIASDFDYNSNTFTLTIGGESKQINVGEEYKTKGVTLSVCGFDSFFIDRALLHTSDTITAQSPNGIAKPGIPRTAILNSNTDNGYILPEYVVNIKNVEISELGIASMTVDGQEYTDITVGQRITIDGISIDLQEIQTTGCHDTCPHAKIYFN